MATRTAPSDSKLQIAATQSGQRVAVTRQAGQTAAIEFKKESEITRQPQHDPKLDKVYAADPKIGALLPRGTKVNLVLVAQEAGTFDFFEDVHPDLNQRNVIQTYEVALKPDPEAQALVNKYSQGIPLTAPEKATLQERLVKIGVQVSPLDPAKSLDAALNGLVIAQKFGG